MLRLNNKTWYYSAKGEGLMKKEPDYRNKLNVHWHRQNQRLFSCFENAKEFLEYFETCRDRHKTFYETIHGDVKQKLYFDIDIDKPEINGEKLIKDITKSIKRVFKTRFNVKITDDHVLVYTSSDKSKQSYHVVVDKYCFESNRHLKQLSREITDSVFVDRAVYSSLQQLRMLFSRKVGSDRVKIPSFEYKDKLKELERSLITNVEGCKLLDFEVVSEEKEVEDFEVDNFVLKQINERIGQDFKITKIEGPLICLKRINPTYCVECDRVHEKENPFIIVEKNLIKMFCRRGNSPKKFVVSNKKYKREEYKEILKKLM